jgi:hypothetical protein
MPTASLPQPPSCARSLALKMMHDGPYDDRSSIPHRLAVADELTRKHHGEWVSISGGWVGVRFGWVGGWVSISGGWVSTIRDFSHGLLNSNEKPLYTDGQMSSRTDGRMDR